MNSYFHLNSKFWNVTVGAIADGVVHGHGDEDAVGELGDLHRRTARGGTGRRRVERAGDVTKELRGVPRACYVCVQTYGEGATCITQLLYTFCRGYRELQRVSTTTTE